MKPLGGVGSAGNEMCPRGKVETLHNRPYLVENHILKQPEVAYRTVTLSLELDRNGTKQTSTEQMKGFRWQNGKQDVATCGTLYYPYDLGRRPADNHRSGMAVIDPCSMHSCFHNAGKSWHDSAG
jgi:hypothetical protein